MFKIHRIITILLAAFLTLAALADNTSTLPPEAKELADKLLNWEVQQREEVEKSIESKREEVIAVMQILVQTETKKGNLDEAIAIRTFIKSFQNLEASPVIKADEVEEPKSDVKNLPLLSRTLWKSTIPNYGTKTLEFDSRGNLFKNRYLAEPEMLDYQIVGEVGDLRLRFEVMHPPPLEDPVSKTPVVIKHEYQIWIMDGKPIALRGLNQIVYFLRGE